jgi:hypothetical protein
VAEQAAASRARQIPAAIAAYRERPGVRRAALPWHSAGKASSFLG